MHSSSSPSPSDKVASPQSIASYRKANGYKRKISPGISIDTRGPFALDKFERPDLEVLAKRQRLDLDVRHDQQDETDTEWLDPRLVDIITGPLGEAHQSPVLEKDEPNNQDDFKSESSLKQFTAKLGGSKYTKFAWDSLIQSTMSKMLPPSPSHSSVDDSTPSNTAFEATSSASTTLLQDEIRRNYVEFVQRNQQRAAERAYYMETVPGFDGVVSPTDEYDEAFERIFLESSDGDAGMDWETDADDVEM